MLFRSQTQKLPLQHAAVILHLRIEVIQSIRMFENEELWDHGDGVLVNITGVGGIGDIPRERDCLVLRHDVLHVIVTQRKTPVIIDEIPHAKVGLRDGNRMEPEIGFCFKRGLSIVCFYIMQGEIVTIAPEANITGGILRPIPSPSDKTISGTSGFSGNANTLRIGLESVQEEKYYEQDSNHASAR